jgi:hypothetical protein
MSALSDTPNVRQPACYAVGLAAFCGGNEYAPVCIATLSTLFDIVEAEGSREEERVFVTENAISAIGKICDAFRTEFDSAPVIRKWVDTLPILNDAEEGRSVYGFLMKLVNEFVFPFLNFKGS